MNDDWPLSERLKSYLTLHARLKGEDLRQGPPWPPEFSALQAALPSFLWLYAGRQPRLYGIRPLVDQVPFRLSDLRDHGYHAVSSRHPVRPPVNGVVDHYLIAELNVADTAQVYLCMYVPPGEWYVLDEHRLMRAPDASSASSGE